MKLERILVPIDFSPQSPAALAAADALAQLGGTHELTLYHVHPIAQVAVLDFTYVEAPEKIAKFLLDAETRLAELAATLKTPEAQRRVIVETGQPLDAILERSKSADLIVMPTHGRTGAQHFLLGSIAERVVQLSKCSVLIVK